MNKSFNIIKYFALLGVFLTPFIVLIVSSNMFFPFITGKNFTFRIMVEVVAALWLVLMIFDARYRPAKGWILWMFGAFLGSMILSSIFGVNFYKSFWSNYERMEGLITYIHLFAYFIALTALLKTEKVWGWFLNTTLGVSVIVAVYGVLQLSGALATHQGNRLDATLGNATYLAIYMVMHIFLAMIMYFRQSGRAKYAYLPVVILEAVVLYYTATRGAILGIMGGLLVSSFLIVLFSQSKKLKKVSLAFIVGILAVSGAFWLMKDSAFVKASPVLTRFSVISVTERTTESRLNIWKMSWNGFKEKPLFGWGPENYNLVFNKYYEPILWKQEPWFDRAHNVFFDRLTMNGMFGLLVYLGLFGSGIFAVWRGKKKGVFSATDAALLTGMFGAYFFHNLFVFDNLASWVLFTVFLAYIHARTSKQSPAAVPQKAGEEFNYGKAMAATVLAGGALFSVYALNVPGIMTSKGIIDAFKLSGTGQYRETLDSFKKAIAYDSFGKMEAREHLANFAMTVYGRIPDQALSNEIMDYTLEQMVKQTEEYPDDIREMVFLASLYNKKGDNVKAIEVLNEAITLSPNKQQLYFELGTSYINSKQYDKGLETLKKSFKLDQEYDEARQIYAVGAVFAGQDKLAEELMKDHGGTIIADERFLKAYASKNNYAKVESILKKFIEQNPSEIQYRLNLAAVYFQTGKRTQSIEQIEEAIKIRPDFKAEGEVYIKQIREGKI
ncbi:MAG: O-antigen ligase family protein [Candidatus Pacebacteria bacterium]|nr:O-antigen ligase family protein [Candidatus Paceibacterota bacterium]NUQ57537.1 O-antigen ligase family protein [Candidatus Paceibacter sp.]